MTVYENLQGMLADAKEILASYQAQGDVRKVAHWARKVEQHRAELARFVDFKGAR